VAGAENLENLCGIYSNWPGKRHEKLAERYMAKTGKPWMTAQVLDGYGQVMIYRDALEKAGKADRRAVAQAIRTLETSGGAAEYFSGPLKWDDRGRRLGAGLVVAQWQGGKPKAVFPADLAVTKPVWGAK
jgi:branched-chain amino acid transport system substrate-binding protein